MSFFNLKSGKQISSSDCLRFQNAWENQDDQYISSFDRIVGELKPSDYFNSKYLGYSDYSGSIYNKANQQIILEEFSNVDGILQIYGGYSYSDILIRLDVLNENEELQKMVLGLEDYPILNEDNLWKLEEEAKEEAWKNWALGDFKKELRNRWNYDFDSLNDDFLRDLFYKCEEKTNEYWTFNYTDAWISIDNILDKLTQDEFLDLFKNAKEEFTSATSSYPTKSILKE